MKKFLSALSLILLVTLSFALETNEIKLTKDLTLTPKKSADWKSGKLIFSIKNPKGNILLPKAKVSEKNGQFLINFATKNFIWDIVISSKNEMLLAKSVITNIGKEELLLEPIVSVKLDNKNSIINFWDGWKVYDIGKEKLSRYGTKGSLEKHSGASTMPFSVNGIFGKKGALILGVPPFYPVSYTAWSFRRNHQYPFR